MNDSYIHDTEQDSDFEHTPDFRCIKIHGVPYTLTPLMAQTVHILHKCYVNGTPDVSQHYILEELNSHSKRLRDIFQNSKDFNTIIIKGDRRGTYRLNI